ncbi:hypothetical protein BJ322DRAFT_1020665 [Thelephora terrestris]|uniref:Uncharacterized protein n=1 Tax=Thelephora terrestris TaxID=56493 RepID=A0A9P6HEF9_9AGAM|nr:hypothetical protein BJ322DRAFT_1020665 [Thelephora terrestris]
MPTTHQAPGPHRPIHLYQPFAGPIPPASIDSRPGLPFGIPLNQSAPILRQFRPRENQASSTSEENRKRSIARNSNKTKRKTQVARAYEEPSASNPVDRNVSVLFFPLNISQFPDSIKELQPGIPRFEISNGTFGPFAQRMFDIGLVFHLRFTDDELLQSNWSLFDRKITDGISSLPARIQLPPRPANQPPSANSTCWTFVKCGIKPARGRSDKRYILVHPEHISSSQWTLDYLRGSLAVTNPISGPDEDLIPDRLIVIGSLTSLSRMVEIPTNICRFGSHECFAYRVLAKEFRDLVEVFDSVTDLCGTKDLRCPSSLSPSLGPDPSSSSPSLSPDPVFTPLPSGSLQTDKMISMGDYVADDDLEAVLAALLEQTNPVGIYNQSPAIHPLITKPQTQPKANKRSRAASHNTGREVDVGQAGAVPIKTAIEGARHSKKTRKNPPPVGLEPVGKGKARESGIVGFTQTQPLEPPFALPPFDISCRDSAVQWPDRISPSDQPNPRRYSTYSPVEVRFQAGTSRELGELLFKFVEWRILPEIDLTLGDSDGTFAPPAGTTLEPSADQIPLDPTVVIHYNVEYICGNAQGVGPRRSAFREALHLMAEREGCWKVIDSTMVPDDSPVADRAYWKVSGALIALALLSGDGVHPVSPAVIYALLSNVEERSDPRAPMDLSLSFINQLQKSKARILLPWMIILPGQDWRDLPTGHRTLVQDLIVDLGIEIVIAILQLQKVTQTGRKTNHVQWTTAIVTSAMFGNANFLSTIQFVEMLKGFRRCFQGAAPWLQACRSLGRTAAIALELSVSSIRCVEDLWTREKIRLVFDPAPVVTDPSMLGEIVIRSFGEYLNRPGHVLLPDGFIADEEMEKERENGLLRVRMLWVYWHGTQQLDTQNTRAVHVDIGMIEQPDQEQAEFPPPLRVNTCFDRLGIQVNGALLNASDAARYFTKQLDLKRSTQMDALLREGEKHRVIDRARARSADVLAQDRVKTSEKREVELRNRKR